MDWRNDETLAAQIRAMNRRQRHQAAYLALRRLQAPLLGLRMPAEWGVDAGAVAALVREGAARLDGEPHDGLTQAVAHLSSAPLFESEVEPEFAESFQLEAINGWLMLEEALGEMSEEQTERLVSLAREMAVYLDDYMDGVLTLVDGEEDRERYLAGVGQHLRAYRLGYFGTRNIEVERRCHETVLVGTAGEALNAPEGQVLQAACDAYSEELLASLRALSRA